MKIWTKSKLIIPMQSLGIVLVVFFAMAFACNDDSPRDGKSRVKTNKSGSCSTEREFKDLLIENFSNTFNERDGKFEETEVEFASFEIGEPFRYRKAYPELIDSEPAYPVTTSFTTRDHLGEKSFPRIFEIRTKNSKYVFYINHRGECAFGLENSGSRETESIPYKQ